MSAIREIKYLKHISHPNIIDLIDVVANPGITQDLVFKVIVRRRS
jgi:hypothetical protein